MMNRLKKILLVVICLILVIVYCLVNNPQRDITLTFGTFSGSNWNVPNGNGYKVLDEAIAKFEKLYPNVTIKYESGILKDDYSSWLSKKIVNGNQPDIFMVEAEDFNTFSSLGLLKNLDSILNTLSIDTSKFYQGALEAGKYYGNQYALPYEINPIMMCINRDLLEKEGVEVPDDDWTVADFYKICKQVTKDTNNDGVVDQFGYYGFSWQDALGSYGLNLFNDDGTKCTLNQQETKEALSYMQKLEELSKNYQVTSDDFDKGNVAFCPLTFAQYRTYQPYPYRVSKYSTFEWSCVKMPGSDTNNKTTRLSSSLIAINSQSSNSELAMEFLKILTLDQSIQQNLFNNSQGMSPLKSVLNSEETKNILNIDALNKYEISQDTLNNIMENVIYDPKFKSYNSIMVIADYNIERALANRSIDDDLYGIQKELENNLKGKE